MHAIQIGNKHTWNDWQLRLVNIENNLPLPKTSYVDVPFANGAIDLTEAFSQDVVYENRKVSFEFDMLIHWDQQYLLIEQISSYIHGQRHIIRLPNDIEHYYVGRLSINQYSTDTTMGKLVIEAICEPYRYKNEVTEVNVTLAQTQRSVGNYLTGGNISAWSTDMDQVKVEASYMGLDTITIPVRFEIPDATSSDISVNQDDIIKYNTLASKLGASNYKYIFEPYPYIAGGTVGETEYNPTDVDSFFSNWESRIKETIPKLNFTFEYAYACSNLVKLESNVAKWTDLYNNLKKTFSAMKLIYRTNWWLTASWAPETEAAYETKLNNPIFGIFDVIGIASYFELHDGENPSQAELRAALKSTQIFGRGQNVINEIKRFNDKWDKPIFLGELNCSSRNKGAMEPWNNTPTEVNNTNIQEALLSAYVEELKGFSWFLGFSLFCIGDLNTTFSIWNTSAKDYIRSLSGTITVSVDCFNGRKKVIPTFVLSAATTIRFGNKIMVANAGTHRFTNVIFSEGHNVIELSGVPGATIKIEYQEGVL